MGWSGSVGVEVARERVGISGKICCRRTWLMMAVEGGAWDRRRVWIKKG